MKKIYAVLCLTQAEYLGKLPPSANAALSFPNFADAKTAMTNILATNSATCGEVYGPSGLIYRGS
jgi:hypothetical protein